MHSWNPEISGFFITYVCIRNSISLNLLFTPPRATGQDGTEQFEDVGHSTDARSLLDDYYIGDVHPVITY